MISRSSWSEYAKPMAPTQSKRTADWDDPRSAGFRIVGIPATFSVIVEDQLPAGHYNVQIESYPPQDFDYLYHKRAVSLRGSWICSDSSPDREKTGLN
jgi:hypothetical protein